MTLPTHVLAGLIIGKITGDYPTAIFGSLIIDLDHVISYLRHGVLFKPKELLKTITRDADPWGDQRNILHSIFGWVTLSLLIYFINSRIGLVFFIAYFFHLILDALDNSKLRPFFPYKKFTIRGPIKYFSKQEFIFDIILFLVFIFINN